MNESFSGGLDDTTVDLDETPPATDAGAVADGGTPVAGFDIHEEANLILISHPEDRHLGKRFRLTWGTVVNIGRSAYESPRATSRPVEAVGYSGLFVKSQVGTSNW